MSQQTVKCTTPDPKHGMTLGDLLTFVADCKRVGLPDTSAVRVTVGFRAQIKDIAATGNTDTSGVSP